MLYWLGVVSACRLCGPPTAGGRVLFEARPFSVSKDSFVPEGVVGVFQHFLGYCVRRTLGTLASLSSTRPAWTSTVPCHQRWQAGSAPTSATCWNIQTWTGSEAFTTFGEWSGEIGWKVNYNWWVFVGYDTVIYLVGVEGVGLLCLVLAFSVEKKRGAPVWADTCAPLCGVLAP